MILQGDLRDAENIWIRAQGRAHPKMPLNGVLDYTEPLSVTKCYCGLQVCSELEVLLPRGLLIFSVFSLCK